MFGRWRAWLAPLIAALTLGILLACGGDAVTPAQPTQAAPQPTPALATPVPTSRATATETPVPPSGLAALKLEVTSPPEDLVSSLPTVTVSGITSPDATVSVNGILSLPDFLGKFSLELPWTLSETPLSIEVIATSISGEEVSVIRTVVFVP